MEEVDEKQFANGFNAGYLMSKCEPELLDKILKTQELKKNFIQAMTFGKKQHEKEKFLSQFKGNDKSKDFGKEL